MTWRHVTCSVAGTRHEKQGLACEDHSHTSVITLQDGTPLLRMFVADGAGSATYGGRGAHEAIQAAKAFTDNLDPSPFQPTRGLGLELIRWIRRTMRALARDERVSERDFACTFQAVLASDDGAIIVHVGDGAIVIDDGNGLTLTSTPKNGDSIDQTHFITDPNVLDDAKVHVITTPITRIASMTDGVTPLAIYYKTMQPHAPFFQSLFDSLATAATDDEHDLQNALAEFLRSPAVNDKTHDDKTLALAIRI